MRKLSCGLFVALFLSIVIVGCSKDSVEPVKPNTPTTPEMTEAEKAQLEEVNTLINAFNNVSKGVTITSIEPVGANASEYSIQFSDGTLANIQLKTSSVAGNAFVRKIEIGDENVSFILTDGKTMTIPLYYAISVIFKSDDLIVMEPNSSREINFTISTIATDNIKVETSTSEKVNAEVTMSSPLEGIVTIKVGETIPEGSYVVIFVTNGKNTVSKRIEFEQTGLQIYNNADKEISSAGGSLRLEFLTNVDCTLLIPEEYQSWIQQSKTRTLEYAYLDVDISPNAEYDREAIVYVKGSNEDMIIRYNIVQKGELGEYYERPDFTNMTVPEDEIWYVTSDNKEVSFGSDTPFDVPILLHKYSEGYGIIKFSGKVTELNSHVFNGSNISEIYLPETIEFIGDLAFRDCKKLKTFKFPSSLKNVQHYAFMGATGLTGFYGNPAYITPDNRCFVDPHIGNILCRAALADVDSYTIPDYVTDIEHYAFNGYENLKSVTFHKDVVFVASSAFNDCPALEAVYGPITTEDHYAIVIGDELSFMAVKDKCPKDYVLPEGITKIGASAFENCKVLETVTMGDQVTSIGDYAFSYCSNLKTITLSANLKTFAPRYGANPFLNCYNLESIYLRAQIPPKFAGNYWDDMSDPKLYVPVQSLELYKRHKSWGKTKTILGHEFSDLPSPDYYYSTDFSQEGRIVTLQKATEGTGIDIVMMGDGYSDRLIADGTYDKDMEFLYDNLFTEEPYRTFKNLFNVYYITAVSTTELAGEADTVFSVYFGDLTYIDGGSETAMEYARQVITDDRMDDVTIVVGVNSDRYAGTCYTFSSEKQGDYGCGPSVSYFAKGGDPEIFASTFIHEVLGHGFGKLADEYSLDNKGEISKEESAVYIQERETNGWWKNVDFTSDPTKVRWAKFLEDSRYASEGLGVFEGGFYYLRGVWRPSQISIMYGNEGGFNAPSREAIYYKINKLAYGDSWQYDYEEFVKQDLNRTRASSTRSHFRSMPKLHSPVKIDKTWKDVINK